MSHRFVRELQQAGIAFDGYRDLAPAIDEHKGLARWPLIVATDQVLVAERWKREALAPLALPGKVAHLPSARTWGQPSPLSDWFLPEAPTAPPRSRTSVAD